MRDIEVSVAFYRDTLGFQVEAQMGTPPTFALLKREGAELALVQHDGATASGRYIYVTNVRGLHDQCMAAGGERHLPADAGAVGAAQLRHGRPGRPPDRDVRADRRLVADGLVRGLSIPGVSDEERCHAARVR